MKHKRAIFLFLALVLAVIAAGSIYYYLADLEVQAKGTSDFREIIVAKETIPAKTLVTAGMLEQREVPVAYIHSQAITDRNEVVGTITNATIYRGEQVLADKIVAAGETGDGFAFTVSAGKRAVAVAVDEVIAVGGLLRPGDRVDVVAIMEMSDAETAGVPVSTVLIQNIKVLAVGQQYDAVSCEQGAQAHTVSLEVSPQEGVSLVLASERGSIRLMLRSPVDEEMAAVAPRTIENLWK